MTAGQEYLAQLSNRPIRLAEAALTFAKVLAYPELRIPAYLDQIERLALAAEDALPLDLAGGERAAALAGWLFRPEGLRGNSTNYHTPENSFLNRVLDTGLGIPITLSVLYIEIARQLGLPAHGVGLPGHFIVRVDDPEGGTSFFDPFHSGRPLEQADCETLVRRTAGLECPFYPGWLEPVAELDLLARMLTNLRISYIQQRDWPRALLSVELLCLTQPAEHGHVRDLGLLYRQAGDRQQAAYHLEAYLMRSSSASDSGAIRAQLKEILTGIARSN